MSRSARRWQAPLPGAEETYPVTGKWADDALMTVVTISGAEVTRVRPARLDSRRNWRRPVVTVMATAEWRL